MVKKKNEGAIAMTSILLISLFVSAVPVGTADEGDTHNIIDEVGTTGFMVLIGQRLNFTGDVPGGVPIIGVLPEDIEGDVFGVTSNNYDTEAFMSTEGIYWIDVDYDGIGGNPAGYDWQDDDDTYLYVCDPHLHLNLKVQGKSVESIQQGTKLEVSFSDNLADTDTVDLKITDPNGTMLTVNPTNANQTFDDINISYLRSHYNNPNGITTDGWQLGNYTFQIITEPNMARGLDACSSTRMLEICKPGITIEADKTSVPPFEYVRLTVKGAQFHKITVNSSNPEHTIFPEGIENNPPPPSVPFNDTIDADGKRSYIVYFNSSGMYKISVRDIDTDLHNSTNISVVIEGINITDRGAIIVTGKPNHSVKIITSCPSKTDFHLGKYDYTNTTQNLEGFVEGIWENGIIDTIDEDGIRKYHVHFSGVGCYKMTVYDIDDTTEDSVISGCNGCRYWYKRHEENPERKQDAWTLNTVFIGESLNITGLNPYSDVVRFEKTTAPFDQFYIYVHYGEPHGYAIMESWDTLFIDEGGYNMSFVREGMSWEDREHKIVYFVEPKLVINITDTEGKRIESAREGQPIMIDVSGTALPEDDVLVRTIEGGGYWWSVGELNLSELRNYQIDTTCWMPGTYSINAETIEEKSRGLRICSNRVDVDILPRTNITPPTAIIDSVTPDPAQQGKDTVSFTGYGIDSEGMVLAYNWRSSIDGQLSLNTSGSFTKPASEFSIGTHTIYFKVLDNDGMWSIEDMENLAIEAANLPPVASFTYSPVNPTSNQTITFNASSSYDLDGNITSYNWSLGDGNITNTTESIIPHSYISVGVYIVNLTVTDNEGATNRTSKVVKVYLKVPFFDTDPGTYPSISGTHNGMIIPTHNVNVSKIYLYPCTGTGGHIEYARIWNSSWIGAEAHWNGYVGDWHNRSFDKNFTLVANETYNYTIITGSYPQIHHTPELLTAKGWTNCTEFRDANGKVYTDWIPAIKLY